MSMFLEIVQTLAVVALGIGAVALAVQLRGLTQQITNFGLLVRIENRQVTSNITEGAHIPLLGGYAIYAWSGQQWRLEHDFSRPGFETTPPQLEGAYEGQLIKKEAVRT